MPPPGGVSAGCLWWRSAGVADRLRAILKDLKREKPWAILKVSRQRYEEARPWKQAGITRALFEELVRGLPDDFIAHCHLEADTERLIDAIFGRLE